MVSAARFNRPEHLNHGGQRGKIHAEITSFGGARAPRSRRAEIIEVADHPKGPSINRMDSQRVFKNSARHS
jgi:hypothetical protein